MCAYLSAVLQMSCTSKIHTWLLMIPMVGLEYLSMISQYFHLVVQDQFCLSPVCFLCIYANFTHQLSVYSIAPNTVFDLFEMKSTFLHHSCSGYIWL